MNSKLDNSQKHQNSAWYMISSTISASMMMSETKMKEGDYRRKEKKNEKIYSLKKLRLAHRRKKNKLQEKTKWLSWVWISQTPADLNMPE